MAVEILDILTLISLVAINVDILFQIRRIYKNKSSRDLSITGLTIRDIAIIILLIKFISISDTVLIIGQALIALTLTAYLVLAIIYFYHKKGLKR